MIELLVLLALVVIAWIALNAVMGIVGLFFAIAVWIFIGYLAGQLLRGKGYGPVGDALLGLGGGLVGSLILGAIGVGGPGFLMRIIGGVLGAVVIIFGVRLLVDSDFAK